MTLLPVHGAEWLDVWRPFLLYLLLARTSCSHSTLHVYRPPTNSMAPAMKQGSNLFACGLSNGDLGSLHRGDVVTFRSPKDPQRIYARRIVALAGDEVRVEAERLLVNGQPVDEPYATWTEEAVFKVAPDYKARSPELFDVGPVRVPADSVYVLSDNRSDGSDSRAYGAIPWSQVIARVLLVDP